MQPVVVVDETKPAWGAIFVDALDPGTGILGPRIQMGQEAKQFTVCLGNQDAGLVGASGANVIGTQRLEKSSTFHGSAGSISRARFRSSPSRMDTGTLSLASSVFHCDRSIITSSTVSL
ncbi:hypothetical protein D3C86_1911160 [compost metagenome]